MTNPKIALVCDWLTGVGGAEKLGVFAGMGGGCPICRMMLCLGGAV